MSSSDAPTSALLPGIASVYQPSALAYDEMLKPCGQLRAHWLGLIEALDRLGSDEVKARAETARRFLRENGVTYNIYGDAKGFERTWEFDPIPMVIPPAEWKQIEAGLMQRSHLLSLIMEDIYSQQRLLCDQQLPPALVFGNPAFLRPCCDIRPARNRPLLFHAVDLARSPDGQWWVLADRTQAPSGAGYTLVNRIALSQVFPDEFRDCRVQRLASFFQVVRDTLRGLAPLNRDNPNVVLLTPGAYNETYFEHAYVARYLGLPLVEGGDLTVRDRRVFIKTLEGLRPVDVILRRIDDTFCDPLELRADSLLGVAGLVEAARAGNVAVANPLGAAVIETPALMPFLPRLCRHLLNEELILPSVATWWCGQPQERAYAIDHLKELVIKRAFPSTAGEPFFGGRLESEQLAALRSELEAAPHAFVAQEQVALSTTPAWREGKLVPAPMVLRVYVVATNEGYRVMPGGLTRVARAASGPIVSAQRGGASKDTWVMAEGPVSTLTLLTPPAPVIRAERRPSEVPSRIADNAFWLGRYVERLEDTIRLLRVVVARIAGESVGDPPPELSALVELLAQLELFPRGANERLSAARIEKHLLLLIYQARRPGSLQEVLNRVREIAFVVRDRFTADTWRIFNKLQMDAKIRPHHLPVTESLALLDTLVLDLSAFNGMAMENMTRGHSWLFLDIGRRLERALHLLQLIRAALRVDAGGQLLLEPILEIADSVMTYRRRYYARPQLSGVLDLLLLDDTNPRSVAFQLGALAKNLAELPVAAGTNGPPRERTSIENAVARIRGIDILARAQPQQNGALLELLENTSRDLAAASDALTLRYFSHADAQAS